MVSFYGERERAVPFKIIMMLMMTSLVPVAGAESVQDFVNSIHEKNKNASGIDLGENTLSKQEQIDLEQWLQSVKNKTPDFNSAENLKRPLTDGKNVDIDAVLARYNKVAAGPGTLDEYSTLIAMVSLSMPDEALVKIVHDVYQAGGKVVIRGLYKNNLKETVLRMQKVIEKTRVGDVNIDPRAFRIFDVKQVPTFVVTEKPIHDCLDKNCNESPVHDKWVGNINLADILEQFSQTGDVKGTALKHLTQLRKGQY